MQHVIDQFAATIRAAAERKAPLCLRGGGSKDFYGNRIAGQITSPPTPLHQVERGAICTLSRKRERDGERAAA